MRQAKDQNRAALRIDRSSTTLRARTIEAMRQGILSLQFKPGDRLIERELCKMADTEQSIRNFRRILEAAKARDPDAMEAACVAQVRHAASVARQMLRETAAAN
jgi:DNA-binding GntR family transcriptional regulator